MRFFSVESSSSVCNEICDVDKEREQEGSSSTRRLLKVHRSEVMCKEVMSNGQLSSGVSRRPSPSPVFISASPLSSFPLFILWDDLLSLIPHAYLYFHLFLRVFISPYLFINRNFPPSTSSLMFLFI